MYTQLSQHFTYKRLLKFVYPAIFMMVFTSIYSVVDGIFVSNFAGQSEFAAVNLIMPVLMGYASFGFMIGAGGSALISKTLGEGDVVKARGIFSLLVYVTIALGLLMTVIGAVTIRPLAIVLKAEREGILDECVLYGMINICGITLFMLQNLFQSFFSLAEKQKLGLVVIVSAGVTNAVLDAVLLAGFHLGLTGAAVATVLGQAVGAIVPLVYFSVRRNGLLYLCKPLLKIKPVLHACANGSSEMMTQLSLALVNILYNYQLISLIGKDGVSAYGVMMYVSFFFVAIFIGYSIGTTPIIGYNYGAGNKEELNNVLKKSLVIIAVSSVAMCGLSLALNYPLPYIFVGSEPELFALTRRGFLITAFMFLVLGFNIFGSSFFTALNNGLVSAIISFVRTLALQVLCVMTLPLMWGVDGVWASNVIAEAAALILTTTLFLSFRKKYGYFVKKPPKE